LPSEIDDFDGDLVVTTEKEAPKQISMPMLFDEIISKDPIVVKGIITKMLNSSTNSSKLVLGIDPGQRIGVSVTYLENEIARAFFVSLDKLIPYLKNDKKNNDEKINFILLNKIGKTTMPNKYKISINELKKNIRSFIQY